MTPDGARRGRRNCRHERANDRQIATAKCPAIDCPGPLRAAKCCYRLVRITSGPRKSLGRECLLSTFWKGIRCRRASSRKKGRFWKITGGLRFIDPRCEVRKGNPVGPLRREATGGANGRSVWLRGSTSSRPRAVGIRPMQDVSFLIPRVGGVSLPAQIRPRTRRQRSGTSASAPVPPPSAGSQCDHSRHEQS